MTFEDAMAVKQRWSDAEDASQLTAINARYRAARAALSSSDDPDEEEGPELHALHVAHHAALAENARVTLLAAGITSSLLDEARAVRGAGENWGGGSGYGRHAD